MRSKQSNGGLLSERARQLLHAGLWDAAVPTDLVGKLQGKLKFRASRNRNGSRRSESEMLEEIMCHAYGRARNRDERDAVAAGFGAIIRRLADVHMALTADNLESFEVESRNEARADGNEDALQPDAVAFPRIYGPTWYALALQQDHHNDRARAAFVRDHEQPHRRPLPAHARTATRVAS